MTTNYSKAWIDFKETEDYKTCSQAMYRSGMRYPYIDNILELCFAAGWGEQKIFPVEEKVNK